MDTEEYRKKIETDILQIIETRLRSGQMSAERAREIAQYIVDSLHPHMSPNQIYGVVQAFDQHFAELVPVVLKVSKDYDEKIKEVVVKHVDVLIKRGSLDEASTLLKNVRGRKFSVGGKQ